MRFIHASSLLPLLSMVTAAACTRAPAPHSQPAGEAALERRFAVAPPGAPGSALAYGGASYGGAGYGGESYGGASYGGATYGAPGDPLAPSDPVPVPVKRKPIRPATPTVDREAIFRCEVDSDCAVMFVGNGCLPSDPRAVARAHVAEARVQLKVKRPEPCGIGGDQYQRDLMEIQLRYGAACSATRRCTLIDRGPSRTF